LLSSAIFTASSTVRRSDAGVCAAVWPVAWAVVCADARVAPRARPVASSATSVVRPSAALDAPAGEADPRPTLGACARLPPKMRIFDASSNSE
jgi:hypothetical protein